MAWLLILLIPFFLLDDYLLQLSGKLQFVICSYLIAANKLAAKILQLAAKKLAAYNLQLAAKGACS